MAALAVLLEDRQDVADVADLVGDGGGRLGADQRREEGGQRHGDADDRADQGHGRHLAGLTVHGLSGGRRGYRGADTRPRGSVAGFSVQRTNNAHPVKRKHRR